MLSDTRVCTHTRCTSHAEGPRLAALKPPAAPHGPVSECTGDASSSQLRGRRVGSGSGRRGPGLGGGAVAGRRGTQGARREEGPESQEGSVGRRGEGGGGLRDQLTDKCLIRASLTYIFPAPPLPRLLRDSRKGGSSSHPPFPSPQPWVPCGLRDSCQRGSRAGARSPDCRGTCDTKVGSPGRRAWGAGRQGLKGPGAFGRQLS